ncbi:MAG: ABC transporter substrate-binding protein [Deltaproteobacteria bacterium HGW-Deltaproteobacteria-18]|jgi:branched-chain amino acid transport system substrate-binding protein|nr:MAG: ABC transporter substrate-binding protein [Deltaproteobacteria bacterium HGW-Deltaproteobacteria-20]PKN42685.1 MAG: ABC transporter substrate-binding protein [Deltaproteobacteria bacterium HGW-Deltaproteobacteria-18]
MSRKSQLTLVSLAILFSALVLVWRFFTGGQDNGPVTVGVAVTLTGNNAELGIQARNGIGLALEDFNAKGGIDGRPVELAVTDDEGTPEGAAAACSSLAEQGVAAVIGHSTSSQTMAGLKVTDPLGIVMISPTASTDALSGKDDFFFRVVDVSVTRAAVLGRHILTDRGCATMAIVYDTVNKAFTSSFAEALRSDFETAGGRVVEIIHFDSSASPDLPAIISKLTDAAPEAICIVASDINTALVSQRIRLAGITAPLFTSSLAFTPHLISHGGNAVEGISTVQSLWVSDDNPEFRPFIQRYRESYGEAAAFGAVFGYEAAMILFEALTETRGTGGEALKKALLGMAARRVLTESISFDAFGDVSRPYSLLTVKDGKFVQGGM